jgi:hypothetical protein
LRDAGFLKLPAPQTPAVSGRARSRRHGPHVRVVPSPRVGRSLGRFSCHACIRASRLLNIARPVSAGLGAQRPVFEAAPAAVGTITSEPGSGGDIPNARDRFTMMPCPSLSGVRMPSPATKRGSGSGITDRMMQLSPKENPTRRSSCRRQGPALGRKRRPSLTAGGWHRDGRAQSHVGSKALRQ